MITIAVILIFAYAAWWLTAPAMSATASYWPMPKGWHAPKAWLGHPSTRTQRATGAWCIHEHEGAWNAATGNGYEGGMQFLESTWHRAGGRSYGSHWASVVSPREQLYRAWVIWRSHGGSWSEWGTARACGLR